MVVAKFNSSGTAQWYRELSPAAPNNANGFGITLDSAGNMYVAGSEYYFNSTGMVNQSLLVKFDNSGNKLWASVLQTSPASQSMASGVAAGIDNLGYVWIAGNTYGQFPGFANDGSLNSFIARYNPGTGQ